MVRCKNTTARNFLLSYGYYFLTATQKNVGFATCCLAASWRYGERLEQCYRSSNIISYWVSHGHTIPYQRLNPRHQTGSPRVGSRRILVAAEPRKR